MNEAPLHFQNEYYGQTTLHPVGMAALVVLGLAMLALPRRWAMLPALALICFVPSSQRVVIAGMDFTFMRLMIMCGWARILLLREYRDFIWRPLDTVICLWALAQLLLGSIITMTPEDLSRIHQLSPSTQIIAVHLGAISHCTLTREDVAEYVKAHHLTEFVRIPEDGELITIP